MTNTHRRGFLVATGAGATAVTAVGLAGPASAAVARSSSSAQESVVAYVEDHGSSTLRLMVGDREVVVHDHDLVTRILNAAGGE